MNFLNNEELKNAIIQHLKENPNVKKTATNSYANTITLNNERTIVFGNIIENTITIWHAHDSRNIILDLNDPEFFDKLDAIIESETQTTTIIVGEHQRSSGRKACQDLKIPVVPQGND